jgi:hypothetical protein
MRFVTGPDLIITSTAHFLSHLDHPVALVPTLNATEILSVAPISNFIPTDARLEIPCPIREVNRPVRYYLDATETHY